MRALVFSFILALVAPSVALADTTDASIDRAYQKEFAYLQAQKTSLTQRAESLEAQARQEAAREKATLDALQGQLVSVQLRADTRATDLTEIDRDATRRTNVMSGPLP